MDKIIVGIIGAGYIADLHLEALKRIPNVEVSVIFDISTSKSKALSERYGIPNLAESIEDLLNNYKCECVHVLVPPQRHFEVSKQVLEKDLTVFSEKPLGITPEEAENLVALESESVATLGIGHNFLFLPSYKKLINLISSGEFGTVDTVDIKWQLPLGQLWSGPFDQWLFESPENLLYEIGPHPFAFANDILPDLKILDATPSLEVSLPNGDKYFRRWHITGKTSESYLSMIISCGDGFPNRTVEVRGTNGVATVDYGNDTIVYQKTGRHGLPLGPFFIDQKRAIDIGSQSIKNIGRQIVSANKLSPYGISFINTLRSFYGDLAEGKQLDKRLSAQSGMRVVNLISDAAALGCRVISSETKTNSQPRIQPLRTDRADVLVTGGTGFIGSNLTDQLIEQGARVRIFTRGVPPQNIPCNRSVSYYQGVLQSSDDIINALKGIETVYHLSQSHQKNWKEFLKSDFETTKILLEQSFKQSVSKFIYTSSISALDTRGISVPLCENEGIDKKIHLRSLYARINAYCEAYLLEKHRKEGWPIVVFRPGVVIGPGAPPQHMGIGMWPSSTVCTFWGSGDKQLPFVLVSDVVKAMTAARQSDESNGNAFNLVGDISYTGFEYLDLCSKFSKLKFTGYPGRPNLSAFAEFSKASIKWAAGQRNQARPSFHDIKARTLHRKFNNQRAKEVLKWVPCTSKEKFDDLGIRQPVEDFFQLKYR